MITRKNFIEREVFTKTLKEIGRADGEEYKDIDTIYGDVSRLVVAWLANTPADKLHEQYNKLGWKGSANTRAIHEAAKDWMERHRPRDTRHK